MRNMEFIDTKDQVFHRFEAFVGSDSLRNDFLVMHDCVPDIAEPVWRNGRASIGHLGIERSRVRNSLVPYGFSLRKGN